MPVEPAYEFHSLRFDPTRSLLLSRGKPALLTPITCELLRVFVTHPNDILSFDFLIERVWDDDLETNNGAVAFQIHALRRILGDDARRPRFIETVTKRGFRFLPKVRRTVLPSESGDWYEKARHFYHKSTPRDLTHAITYYQRIVERNQGYVAEAYGGIADCFVLLGTFAQQTMPASEAMAKAREAALMAVSLDPDLAEAYAALASVAVLFDWQWQTGLDHLSKAYQLTSNPLVKPLLHAWHSQFLAARGEIAQARQQIDRAKAEFPSSFLLAGLSGRVAYFERNVSLAVAETEEGITLEENFFLNHLFLGHALRLSGNYAASEQSFQRALQLSGGNPVCLSELGHIYGLQRREHEARGVMEELAALTERQYVSPYLAAHIFLGLQQFDGFFDALAKCLATREAYMVFLEADPVYDGIRSDPRFRTLVEKVGFAKTV